MNSSEKKRENKGINSSALKLQWCSVLFHYFKIMNHAMIVLNIFALALFMAKM